MGTEANDIQFTRGEEPLRQYLLGALPPEEQRRLEEQLLFDNELIEHLLVVEQEMIDDYARDALPVEEREQFVTHFLAPPERRKKVEIARALQRYVATERAKPQPQDARETKSASGWPALVRSLFAPVWRLPIAAALLLGLAVGAWWLLFYQLPIMRGVAALKQAYPRPSEARLSGFSHAPWSQMRSGAPEKIDTFANDRAERLLFDVVADWPRAKSYHALGQLYLAQGKFDQAISQFDEALKTDNSAQTHNDLGVALMGLAKKQKEKEARGETTREQDNSSSLLSLGRANEHFAQALRIDAKLAEAQFNQALCLQEMGLVNQATEAWQKYLQLDTTSEWANEARQKLAELQERKKRAANSKEQIVQDYLAAYQSGEVDRIREAFNLGYENTGNLITSRLLDEYLQLSLEGKNKEAQQRIEWLTQAASLEAQLGDLYTQDLINLYRGVSPRHCDSLLKARRLLQEAAKVEDEKDAEALPLYQKAQTALTQAGSLGEASLAAYRITKIKHSSYGYQEAQNEAESLINFATTQQYRRLEARTYGQIATIYLGQKEYSQALAYSNRALSMMTSLADPKSESTIRVQQALIYSVLGNPEHALILFVRPFELNRLYPISLRNQWFIYDVAADCFHTLNLLFTAIACEQEALHFAREMNNQLYQSRSYAYIGEMQSRLDNMPEAIEQIEVACKIGQSMGGTPMGQDIVEHALLRLGHLYRKQGDWEKALMLYDESLRLSDGLQKDHDKLNIHRGKLMVHLAHHDTAKAQAELQAVLSLFEKNVASITQESLRNSFFDTGQDIYDLALQFASDYLHDQGQAFDYSERGRARSLLDLLKDKSSYNNSLTSNKLPASLLTTPLSLAEIRQQMPPDIQIVQYALLSDALHIWVISRESFHSITNPIRLSDLNAKITAYIDCLAQQGKAESNEARQLSEELYSILIGSVESHLDANKELCIIPDESLNYLPFGSLIEPHARQYLIEKYTLLYAPSATVFLACTDTAKMKAGFLTERCLSIGNPLFDRETFPELDDLPAAAREAERIMEFYPDPAKRLLLAGDASVQAFRREAPEAEVIHLASHGLVNTQRPEYSGILLAKDAAHVQPIADGFLSAGEVLRLRLPRTKLVVLSACQTWLGHNYHGEGMVGLARAFIVAGAPLVVSSLWKVDSEATGELMKSFHRHRTQKGCSTTRALREAQLEMLRQPHLRSPNVWAAFMTVGGHASY